MFFVYIEHHRDLNDKWNRKTEKVSSDSREFPRVNDNMDKTLYGHTIVCVEDFGPLYTHCLHTFIVRWIKGGLGLQQWDRCSTHKDHDDNRKMYIEGNMQPSPI